MSVPLIACDEDRRPEAERDREHLIEEEALPAGREQGEQQAGPATRRAAGRRRSPRTTRRVLGARRPDRRLRCRGAVGPGAGNERATMPRNASTSSTPSVGRRARGAWGADEKTLMPATCRPRRGRGNRRLLGGRSQARRSGLLPLHHPPWQTPSIRPCCTQEAPAAVFRGPEQQRKGCATGWSVVERLAGTSHPTRMMSQPRQRPRRRRSELASCWRR